MTRFFANYGFHPQTEWMKEREAHNPGVTLYAHWMQDIHQQAKQTLENTRESMKKYYDQKATTQLNIEVGDLVMLNAKNIRTKRPSKKLSSKLYGPFKVLEKKGGRSYRLEISPTWKVRPVVSRLPAGTLPSLEPTKSRTTPTRPRRDRGRLRMGTRKDCQE